MLAEGVCKWFGNTGERKAAFRNQGEPGGEAGTSVKKHRTAFIAGRVKYIWRTAIREREAARRLSARKDL